MEQLGATAGFEALAHQTRLAVFRLLIPAGPEGVAAGEIGERLQVPPHRLSFHLRRLAIAGLIRARREGRHLYYAADYAYVSELVGFLVNDCCADAPAGCLPECPATPTFPTSARPASAADRRRQGNSKRR